MSTRTALLDAFFRFHGRANQQMHTLLERRRLFEIMALALVTVAAARALTEGIDVRQFYNADALFPVHILQYGLFDYRPPPSSNLFPDLLVHWVLSHWVTDPLTQKLLAGAVLVLLLSIAVAILRGFEHQVLILVIFSFTGFYYFDSTAHFALPLCMLLYMSVGKLWLRQSLLFLIVFSDLLVLVPLAMYLFSLGRDRRSWSAGLIIILAIGLNLLFSDFSSEGPKVIPVALAFAVIGAAAMRVSMVECAMVAIALVFVILSAMVLMPDRYGFPIAATLLLMALPCRQIARGWHIVALPLALIAVFFAGLNSGDHDLLEERYACLVNEVESRGIESVATEYWTSKPLHFALERYGKSEVAPLITQIDFATGKPLVWMGPYAFAGKPTNWAVSNRFSCPFYTTDASSCGQLDIGVVQERYPVCSGTFELIRYRQPLPVQTKVLPDSRVGWAIYHLSEYLTRVRLRLAQKLGLSG